MKVVIQLNCSIYSFKGLTLNLSLLKFISMGVKEMREDESAARNRSGKRGGRERGRTMRWNMISPLRESSLKRKQQQMGKEGKVCLVD